MEDTFYQAKISGSKIMMNNEQKANPFNSYAQELAKISRKRQKSLEDHEEIARIEYQGGLYHDEKIGPYVPGHCLQKMLVEGAKRRRLGSEFAKSIIIVDMMNPLRYAGPRDRAGLWQARERFADQRLVGIGPKRCLRTRPSFTDWSLCFVIQVMDGAVDEPSVREALNAAQSIGLLDGRPMYAGQFHVDSFAVLREVSDAAAE